MGVGKAKNVLPSIVIYILMFQNLFNAASPYLTLILNLMVAVIVIKNNGIKIPNPPVLAAIHIILTWFIVVVVYRGDFDNQILMKYFRITLAATLLALIFGSRSIDSKKIVMAINFSLGFHVLLILVQIGYPDITNFTAELFGFDRDAAILEQYSQRKLGASSSYDTASLLSIASLIFFYLQFSRNRNITLLILVIISFAASLMSSRAGIALSLATAIIFFFHAYLESTAIWRYAIASALLIFFTLIYVYISPIFLHSVGLTELSAEESYVIFAAADYGTTGTLDALTDEHLKPLDLPIYDLFIGFAIDPNSIGKYTDIGYVKLVYHVGIIGVMMIMAIYAYMGMLANKYRHRHFVDKESKIIATFLLCIILVACIFNYKSLEIYSRGVGDFIFIIFFFLCGRNYTSTSRSLIT